jgi:uncharacterized lipoprotein YddW (UPF0748 family)
MKKKTLKSFVLLFSFWSIVYGLWSMVFSLPSSGQEEIRAFWVTREEITSPEKIERIILVAKKYNFNTLFVQVRARGEAFYNSKIEPRARLLENQPLDFDPLNEITYLAHQNNLEVHAWVNIFYVWPQNFTRPTAKNHAINRFPTFLTTGEDKIFVSPAEPEAQNYTLNICTEIIDNYDVDGLHLDYIRYPSDTPDIQSREKFYAKFGIDPALLYKSTYPLKESFSKKERKTLREKWVSWRCDQVSNFVRRLYKLASEIKPSLKISAAVFADYNEAKARKGQDWKKWLDEEIVDFIVPMAYAKDNKRVYQQILNAAKVSKGRFVVAGLGAWQMNASSLIEKVKIARKLKNNYDNLKGVALFSYDRINQQPDYLIKLKQTIFQNPSSVPSLPWK